MPDAPRTDGPHYMPPVMLDDIVNRLMRFGDRGSLILAGHVNDRFGRSARKRWDSEQAATALMQNPSPNEDTTPNPVYVTAPRWQAGAIIGIHPARAIARWRREGEDRLVVIFPDGKVDVPIREVATYPNVGELMSLPHGADLMALISLAESEQFYPPFA